MPTSTLSQHLPAAAKLPTYALPVIGPGKLPWDSAKYITEHLEGLWGGGVFSFPKTATSGPLLVVTTDADIDADGPGGSKEVDPDYEPGTTLHFPNGFGCNSRQFPGVVIPPAFRPLGVWMGDFGVAIWKDANGNPVIHRFQVYDVGPTRKLGEISLYLGRLLGIIPPSQSDHSAATHGNDVNDLVVVFFCGSGPGRTGNAPGHAVASPLITQYGDSLLAAALMPRNPLGMVSDEIASVGEKVEAGVTGQDV